MDWGRLRNIISAAAVLLGILAFAGHGILTGDDENGRQQAAEDTPAPTPPTFTRTNLIADVAGTGKASDANLVNPWGMALGVNSGIWVADNGSGRATTYDGAGQAIPSGSPQIVTIPAARNGSGTAKPTGVVTNATPGFIITGGANSAPSTELFATEDGTIAGWNSSVDPTRAVIAVDNSASGAVYKGLAMGFTKSGAFLFATNFHAGTIDVFDSKFKPSLTHGTFTDPKLPAGYAPFGISAINGKLYVTYALPDAAGKDDVRGAGHGFINIFDTDGNFVERFTSQGQLNSPWGMAWAPFEGFGGFNNALLVGNFGDGTINAFDFDSGELLGKVNDSSGAPIKIPGLWGLQFGLGAAGTTSSTLFFTAGTGDEEHGLFGTLTVNAASLPAAEGPTMVDPNLHVTTVISGLDQPTSMAFLGPGDFLVLEKASGKVQYVVNGAIAGTALDLAVNSASERGLLGIALQPDFADSHGVFLYWTQSSTSADTTGLAQVPLLGNRVDRYTWDAASQKLVFNKNIIMLRSFQADAGQPMRGNHDGGKMAFGPDGKLYIQIGDQGRRGQLQNLPFGPTGGFQPDDQFGGPAPDAAHLTGVILRLNPDGSTPTDNPFAGLTAEALAPIEQSARVSLSPPQLSEVVANLAKVYSYGRRNSFGLAFDPMTGFLWESENGDDAFDEMNRITAGSNGGWIQIIGPAGRVPDYKQIESSLTPLQGNLPVAGNVPFSAIDPTTFIPALQQVRWPPTLIADSTDEARARLFVLPGSHYEDPEFSWKWAVAPAAIGFAGTGLGPQHAGNLFVGGSRTFLDEGYLFEFKFDSARRHFAFSDAKLQGGVDENDYKFDEGLSENLVAGKNFGIVTNIVTGPDGSLYVTSLSNGKVYMIR
jgi:uncharacterized protein (TIGR03118 family)